jgi:hypothetical protein
MHLGMGSYRGGSLGARHNTEPEPEPGIDRALAWLPIDLGVFSAKCGEMSRYRYLRVEGVGHGVGRGFARAGIGVGELWVRLEGSEG